MLPNVQLRTGEQCAPLPGWARVLVDLGGWVGFDAHRESRLVLALGLPTRAYAAPLVSAGIVAARVSIGSRTDVAAHFEDVCCRPSGTPVLLEVTGRQYDGMFLGCAVIRGERWAKIAVQGGAATHFVCEAESLRIALRDVPVNSPARHAPAARTLVQRRAFLRQALGRAALATLTRESHLECVIVGRCSTLCYEANELCLAVPSAATPGRSQRARLSDVLRVRRTLGAGQPYRSEVVSALGRRAAAEAGREVPHAVVFDGATSFLKWRHLWPQSNWAIVLDHTEARCTEAAATVDALYRDRAVGEAVPFPLAGVSSRVDLAGFRLPVAVRERTSVGH